MSLVFIVKAIPVKVIQRACAGFILAVIVGVALSPAPANAAQDRCLILGPLAVSSYIGLLEQVARGKRDEAAKQSQNASDTVALYERLGCPQKALIKAIECLSSHVVSPKVKKPVNAIAKQCMEKAGMPTR